MVNISSTRRASGQHPPSTRARPTSEIVADALRTFERAGYRHHRGCAARRPVAYQGGPAAHAQVLINLLTNSAKFAAQHADQPYRKKEKEASPWRPRRRRASPETLNTLFAKFSQVSRTSGRHRLGLWIRAASSEYGGRIWASEGAVKGSTFSFTRRCSAEPVVEAPVGNLRILAVDDEPSICASWSAS
jgi:K+-sensing histidine kinase KdpD